MAAILVEWDLVGPPPPRGPDASGRSARDVVPILRVAIPDAQSRRAWDDVVDHTLIPWANGQVEVDDDLIRPSSSSLRTATRLAQQLRDDGHKPPTAVLPDGDGGILFERRRGLASSQINVLWDGDVELVEYNESGLVRRDLLPAKHFG